MVFFFPSHFSVTTFCIQFVLAGSEGYTVNHIRPMLLLFSLFSVGDLMGKFSGAKWSWLHSAIIEDQSSLFPWRGRKLWPWQYWSSSPVIDHRDSPDRLACSEWWSLRKVLTVSLWGLGPHLNWWARRMLVEPHLIIWFCLLVWKGVPSRQMFIKVSGSN